MAISQDTIQIGNVNNKIQLGPFAGSRDLAFGVQSILEEVIQDKGYNLSYNAETQIQVDLLFFDVQKTKVQVAIYSKNTDEYQIIARASLIKNGKKKKQVTAKGTAKEISTATLIIDKGGQFSQTNVSTALKKVCVQLINKLKL
tara:strand:+ start:235 stop:666 length:432 start_codon:yes stop_codon:yes gene_type:complete